MPFVLLFALVGPCAIQSLNRRWQIGFSQADVFAGDDAQPFPAVLAVTADVQLRRPKQRLLFEPAPDGFLEGAGDFGQSKPSNTCELRESHSGQATHRRAAISSRAVCASLSARRTLPHAISPMKPVLPDGSPNRCSNRLMSAAVGASTVMFWKRDRNRGSTVPCSLLDVHTTATWWGRSSR